MPYGITHCYTCQAAEVRIPPLPPAEAATPDGWLSWPMLRESGPAGNWTRDLSIKSNALSQHHHATLAPINVKCGIHEQTCKFFLAKFYTDQLVQDVCRVGWNLVNCRTAVQQLTRFQLTQCVARSLCDSWDSSLYMSYRRPNDTTTQCPEKGAAIFFASDFAKYQPIFKTLSPTDLAEKW